MLNFRWPACDEVYIDDLVVISGDGCNLSFFCDDVEGDCECAIHFFVEVGVIAEIGAFEKVFDLGGACGT